MLNLVDHFGGTFLIFVLAIGELTGVMWIYGLESFCNDIQFMIGRRPSWYWRVCWLIITPIFMIVVFIYSMATLQPLLYAGKEYPESGYSEFGTFIMRNGIIILIKSFYSCRLGFLRTGRYSVSALGNVDFGLKIDLHEFPEGIPG